MTYLNDQILENLREARKRKGFSQRELSAKSGVPQSHISKIESGAVDLRVSSLVALARVLDLELELVPRKTVPAVKSIVRSSTSADVANTHKLIQREMDQYKQTLASINQIPSIANRDLEKLSKAVADIDRFKLDNSALKSIASSRRAIEEAMKQSPVNQSKEAIDQSIGAQEAMKKAVRLMSALRNSLAHGNHFKEAKASLPAYSLDRGDDE
jgi:transcriptional regulator with XRE-family HTH domain